MRPTIIVMSHGNMAQETLNSAKMIVGEIENAYVVGMKDNDGLSGTNEKLELILAKLTPASQILVLADLKGGTPCNVAMMKMADYPNLSIVSGLNLGMLVEAIFASYETAADLATYIETIGKEAISKIEPTAIESDDDVEFEEE